MNSPSQKSKMRPFERDIEEFIDHTRVERGFAENTAQAYTRDLAQYAGWLQDAGVTSARRVEPHKDCCTRSCS